MRRFLFTKRFTLFDFALFTAVVFAVELWI
jgi:hypothetical protein